MWRRGFLTSECSIWNNCVRTNQKNQGHFDGPGNFTDSPTVLLCCVLLGFYCWEHIYEGGCKTKAIPCFVLYCLLSTGLWWSFSNFSSLYGSELELDKKASFWKSGCKSSNIHCSLKVVVLGEVRDRDDRLSLFPTLHPILLFDSRVRSPSPEARMHPFPWTSPSAPCLWHSFWQSADNGLRATQRLLISQPLFSDFDFLAPLPIIILILIPLFYSSYLIPKMNPNWFN